MKENKDFKKIIVDGQEFILDEDSWKIYIFDFDDGKHKIFVKDDYLTRKNTQDYFESFHRFIMKNKIIDFSENNKIEVDKLDIDHINGDTHDDRIDNLQILTKKFHERKHEDYKISKREEAWKRYLSKCPKRMPISVCRKKFNLSWDIRNMETDIQETKTEEE